MTVTAQWSDGGGRFGVLVHGGAGELSLDRHADHAEGCRRAAHAALEILAQGGRALDATQRAVELLEDDPRFNAGTGACLTSEGHLELDAALMDGESLRAGGVCALPPFRNPITIARAVLESGRHVLYAADGAAAFAEQNGFVRADEQDMVTDAARTRLARLLQQAGSDLWTGGGGTVGAVARDAAGNVAAATSTGGLVGKRPGRVGDSALLGAGTYADNTGGAASATGQGEGILRVNLTGQLIAALRMGHGIERAVAAAIQSLSARANACAGVIAVDTAGKLAFARSTATMSWAAGWDGGSVVAGT